MCICSSSQSNPSVYSHIMFTVLYIYTYIFIYLFIYIHICVCESNAWALPRRCSVVGSHPHSTFDSTYIQRGRWRTFNWEDEEASKFPAPWSSTFNWEELKFPAALSFTFDWKGERNVPCDIFGAVRSQEPGTPEHCAARIDGYHQQCSVAVFAMLWLEGIYDWQLNVNHGLINPVYGCE